MADRTEFAPRPTQIPKDVQGSDNTIPLSPQWLLPKPGESKTGSVAGENNYSPRPLAGHANRSDITKPSGTGENENVKKKDVFRPSVLDMESGSRDRWRDEERDTNSSVRKDRWKEGEREHTDNNRRMDRWTDSSGVKNQVEPRRTPGERWNTDSGNKDHNDQRRESKWNTDSGNKDNNSKWNTESGNKDNNDPRRESKWNNRWGPDKEADSIREKWVDPVKDSDGLLDKGSFHLPSNGKDEKDGDHFRPWRPNAAYGRGRGDSLNLNKQPPTFSAGRGRLGSGGTSVTQTTTNLQPRGERVESGLRENYVLKYNRTKLIDVYRTADTRYFAKHLEGFTEVPSLTQEEPTEPLAFSTPTSEELVILMGIDKGEILSSDALQISKDSSAGRTTTDFMSSRRGRIGSKDDLPASADESRHEMQDNPKAEASTEERKADDAPSPWRSSSFAERSQSTSYDWRDKSNEFQKESNSVWDSRMDSPNTRKGQQWQTGDDSNTGRQPSAVFDREMEAQKVSQPSPEDLVLFYKDPQGAIQGPFVGIDIIQWFESGYFGLDLQVRLATASADSPFFLLGDVMPHLRSKARPPPGFSTTPKPIEADASRSNLSNFGVHAVSSEAEVLKIDPRYKHGATADAENRYLESLMAGRLNNALSEGLQGYGGNLGGDLLAKKMNLDRQRSLPNPYANLLSSVSENARLQQHPQNVDLLSVLQGLPDRSTASMNSGISSWMNFPVLGASDPLQNHNQNFLPQSAFGMQQQRVQPQNPLVANLLPQSMENPSTMLTPEKMLASGFSQDPQLLNLLQQQYLLQLQSQNPVPLQQMSPLDKLLFLKQQQKQEEQQQILRQQQQLLSQMLSEQHRSQQLSSEPPYSPLQTGGFTPGNAIADPARVQQHELFQLGSRQVPNVRDMPPSVTQGVVPSIGSDASTHLHQLFGNNVNQRSWDASQMDHVVNKPTDSINVPALSEKVNAFSLEQLSHNESTEVGKSNVASEFPSGKYLGESMGVGPVVDIPGFVEPKDVVEPIKELIDPEVREVKKSSEKKSKKQKALKVTADSVKPVSKSQQPKSSEFERTQFETLAVEVNANAGSTPAPADDPNFLSSQSILKHTDIDASQVNSQTSAGRAWKPAPGFRPKSFLEIQQEEQRRAQEEMAVSEISPSVSTMSVSTPWSGMHVTADHKEFSESKPDFKNTEPIISKPDSSSILKSKKSQEDLFWDTPSVKETGISSNATGVPFASITSSKSDSIADDDFIEAKDTKKSRKKSTKAKNGGSKVAPLVQADTSVGPSPMDKVKHSRQMQQEELLPAVPSGPSLGDFVFWKDETAGSSLAPAPAWSTDSGKPKKATSLRDIVKEQEKKVSSSLQAVPVPTPQKPVTSQPVRGNATSWSMSSSPAKAASPIQINSKVSSHSKHKVEGDLFWGPSEQSKPEAKQSDFPQLGNLGNRGIKSTPTKGTVGSSNRQKSTGNKPADHSLSASTQPSQKGKMNAATKHSDALDFKEWCEGECTRLVGSQDTSFLEYCLKQSRSEAEMLLTENLGSYDPGHEFIDKFLNYKDFLPADVLEMAFKIKDDRKPTSGSRVVPSAANNAAAEVVRSSEPAGPTGGGGKKKGKKGKKVSPSVLGFSVVSNRIMMGEIQTIED